MAKKRRIIQKTGAKKGMGAIREKGEIIEDFNAAEEEKTRNPSQKVKQHKKKTKLLKTVRVGIIPDNGSPPYASKNWPPDRKGDARRRVSGIAK